MDDLITFSNYHIWKKKYWSPKRKARAVKMFFQRDLPPCPPKQSGCLREGYFVFSFCQTAKSSSCPCLEVKEAKQGSCYVQEGTGKKWTKAKGKKASENVSRKQGVEAGETGSPCMCNNSSWVSHCQIKPIYPEPTVLLRVTVRPTFHPMARAPAVHASLRPDLSRHLWVWLGHSAKNPSKGELLPSGAGPRQLPSPPAPGLRHSSSRHCQRARVAENSNHCFVKERGKKKKMNIHSSETKPVLLC